MLNRAIPGVKTLASVSPLLQSADLAFANLEVPLTSSKVASGAKSPEELKRHDQYILKAAPGHAFFISKAGIRMVSLGNNHCMDYGPAGLFEMKAALRQAGIASSGAGANRVLAMKPAIVRLKDGTRVGLLSAMAFVSNRALAKTTPATAKTAGVSTLAFNGVIDDAAKAMLGRWVGDAKRHCDIVIVALHWGTERKSVPNPYQVQLGRAVADAGADVVWGHHPHVLQGAEVYHGVPILYSMGNFVSSLPGNSGLVEIQLGAKEKKLTFHPFRIQDNRAIIVTGRAALAAQKNFADLCRTVKQKFPIEKKTKELRSL